MTEYVPQELVNAFVASTGCHFRELERGHGLRRSLVAEVVGPGGVLQVPPAAVGDRFFALTLSLAGPGLSIDVTYGGREHDLGCAVRARGVGDAFALWEWLEVLGRPELLADPGGWVVTTDRVESVVAQYDAALREVAPAVAAAESAIGERLVRNRQARIRQDRERQDEAEHRRLAAQADEAFRRADYRTVVEALSAVRAELTPAERQKLAYARKQLGA